MHSLSVAVLTDTAHQPLAIAAGSYHPVRSPESFFARLPANRLSFHPYYNRHDRFHPPKQPYASSPELLQAFFGFYRTHRTDVVLVYGDSAPRLFTQALELGLISHLPHLINIAPYLCGASLEAHTRRPQFTHHLVNRWDDPLQAQQKHLQLIFAAARPNWRQATPPRQAA